MGTARAYAACPDGASGHLVEVEAHVADGPAGIVLVGLSISALREARDRIRAAVTNSGQKWPKRKITIGLSPMSLPKLGGGFDLAMAVALLAAHGAVPFAAPRGIMFMAELGLDGTLRPVPDIGPAVKAAADAGITSVVVAPANAAEAARGNNVRVVSAENLAQLIEWLRGGRGPVAVVGPPAPPVRFDPQPDFRDYPGSEQARLAAEVCAAGGHGLLITGRPGTGKRGLAERIPGLLPDLPVDQACVATWTRGGAGAMIPGEPQIVRPPFLHPHHTSPVAALIGGGCLARPGAVTLADHGVLLLDNAPEFSRDVLDALREPLETNLVTLRRSDSQIMTYPAKFQLIVTAMPCPCGAPDDEGCKCSPSVLKRYLGRLTGPLTDRAEVKVQLEPTGASEVRKRLRSAEPSAVIAGRVAEARERSARRLAGTPWRLNSEIPCCEMRRSYLPEPGAMREVERLLDLERITERGISKILRIAWTLTDLAGRNQPDLEAVHTAHHLFCDKSKKLTFHIPHGTTSAIQHRNSISLFNTLEKFNEINPSGLFDSNHDTCRIPGIPHKYCTIYSRHLNT